MSNGLIGDIVAAAAGMHRAREKATSYTDYIAHVCAVALSRPDPERIINTIGQVRSDLHQQHGYSLSTKKTLEVEDRNGNRYRVTIEDIKT